MNRQLKIVLAVFCITLSLGLMLWSVWHALVHQEEVMQTVIAEQQKKQEFWYEKYLETRAELDAVHQQLEETATKLQDTTIKLQDTTIKLQNAKARLQDTAAKLQATEAQFNETKENLYTVEREREKLRYTSMIDRSKSSRYSRQTKLKPGSVVTVEATAYTANCNGCIGITATGIDVRKETPKIIAVDPDVIRLGSAVELIVDGKSWGVWEAQDTGGDIKGLRIDILMDSEEKALQFGRKKVKLKILN